MAGVLALGLTLASRAHTQTIDKVKLGEARSLIAEAAKTEAARAQGRVTSNFADALQADITKALEKLKTEPGLSAAVEGALTAIDCHDAASLDALRQKLQAQERALGRAG